MTTIFIESDGWGPGEIMTQVHSLPRQGETIFLDPLFCERNAGGDLSLEKVNAGRYEVASVEHAFIEDQPIVNLKVSYLNAGSKDVA